MSDNTKAVLELQDTIQIFRDVRQKPDLLGLDTFIFAQQDVSQQERAARLQVMAQEMEMTAAYIRRLLEVTRF